MNDNLVWPPAVGQMAKGFPSQLPPSTVFHSVALAFKDLLLWGFLQSPPLAVPLRADWCPEKQFPCGTSVSPIFLHVDLRVFDFLVEHLRERG